MAIVPLLVITTTFSCSHLPCIIIYFIITYQPPADNFLPPKFPLALQMVYNIYIIDYEVSCMIVSGISLVLEGGGMRGMFSAGSF